MSIWNKFKSEFEEAVGYSVGNLCSPESDHVEIAWEEDFDVFGSLRGSFGGYNLEKNYDTVFTVSKISIHPLPDLYDVRWTLSTLEIPSREETYKTVVSTPLQAVAAILLESHIRDRKSPSA